MQTNQEPTRQIPVVHNPDILVIESGSAKLAFAKIEALPKLRSRIDLPKFSSWSFMPTSLCRHFHAMQARLRPIVQLKRITKWVRYFQT